jgi:hypothetical protein
MKKHYFIRKGDSIIIVDEFCKLCQNIVRKRLRDMTGSQDSQTVGAINSYVMLNILKNIMKYGDDHIQDMKPFIRTTATRCIIRYYITEGAKKYDTVLVEGLEGSEMKHALLHECIDESGFEQVNPYFKSDHSNLLDSALLYIRANLTDKEYMILYYWADSVGPNTIAEIFNWKKENKKTGEIEPDLRKVNNKIHRILEKIRTWRDQGKLNCRV